MAANGPDSKFESESVNAMANPSTRSCAHCRKSGHSIKNCYTLHPELRNRSMRGRGCGNPRGRGGRSNQSAPKDLLNYLDDKVIIRSSSVLVDKEEMNLVNHAKPVHLATQVIIDSSCSRHVVRDNFSKYFTSRTNITLVTLRLPDGKTYTSNEKVSMTL